MSGCLDDPTATTTQAAVTTPSPYSVYCQEKCMAIYGWMVPDKTSSCLMGCSFYEASTDITTPKEQDQGWKEFSVICHN